MLTPKFEVKQDEKQIIITVFAPYARISDAEVNIDEDTFTFYSSPYYLRLTFSGKLTDSELERYTAKFDADQGAFVIQCEKQVPGEHFANLDMLTTLLAPQGASSVKKPLIEVVGGNDDEAGDEEEDENIDWFLEQTLPDENVVTAGHKYGFANKDTGVFTALQNELKGVIDIADPDNKSASARRKERIACEQSVFDEDHYLADYFEMDTVREYLEFIPEFYSVTSDEVELDEVDKEDLLKLPRKEHLLDKGAKSIVYLGLVDILYSWCYNHRITLGENCPESAWNIAKLSATLSWLDSFTHLRDVVTSSMCRSLIYPLIRNWQLSKEVLKDTIQILTLGRKKVLHCLLEIQREFNNSEPRYLLNQLYITDYCTWIQTVKNDKLISLADSLKKVNIAKKDVGLELEDLEVAAHLVLEEESANSPVDNMNNLATQMGDMTIIENGAALGVNENEFDENADMLNNQRRSNLIHISDSDSSSSDSDSDEDSDDDTDTSDSSDEDSSDDSDQDESTSDSSDLDSDDDTLSESEES